MLFTIGYETLTPATLAWIAAPFVRLVDCRTTPSSRRPGFGRAALQTAFGNRYVWEPNLGGLHQRAVHPAVLKLLERWYDQGSGGDGLTLLLCREEAPGDCHRHDMLAMPLVRRGRLNVWHIFDGRVIRADHLQRAIDDDHEPEEQPVGALLPHLR